MPFCTRLCCVRRQWQDTSSMSFEMNSTSKLHLSPLQRLRRLPFVAWIIFYCAVLWGIFGALLGAVTPNLREQMGLSFDQVGWLMALWTSGGAVGSLLGGAIAKRFLPRRLLRAYSSAVVLALAGLLLAPGFVSLALCMVLIAVFETALFTLGHGLLSEISEEPEERTRIISLVDVSYSMGTILSPLVVSAVLLLTPWWRAPYAVFGVLAISLWVLTLQKQRLHSAAFRRHEAAGTGSDQHVLGYVHLLRQPLIQRVCAAGLFSGFIEWGQYFWFVSYASVGLGMGSQGARLALGFLMVGMTVGRLWQAFIPSRWSMGQKLQGLSVLGALALVGMALLPLQVEFAYVAILNFLAGLGVSVGFPILLGSALQGFPAQAPRLSAILMITFTVGSQLAALLLGYLAEIMGLRTVYSALALGAIALCLTVWRLVKFLSYIKTQAD